MDENGSSRRQVALFFGIGAVILLVCCIGVFAAYLLVVDLSDKAGTP
ncbi:putative membrane protein [Allocatelliglobosispora scoriae]|uniref:Putative membrane protein n=1 Tax=Allocatelliglobosispora scoriae TaxID=643052 RepID=A0A841C0T1_9ACTN|nr:hypothetical protein [Allocatelliglobosispora scoriae]MBB5873984.1 putative membrane protein [Allocatelliglobosispora scoriae]